jgi:hypothetical protein
MVATFGAGYFIDAKVPLPLLKIRNSNADKEDEANGQRKCPLKPLSVRWRTL